MSHIIVHHATGRRDVPLTRNIETQNFFFVLLNGTIQSSGCADTDKRGYIIIGFFVLVYTSLCVSTFILVLPTASNDCNIRKKKPIP